MMLRMMMFPFAMLFVITLLVGCQSGSHGLQQSNLLINAMNTQALIEHDFEHGRIMRARARVLVMDRSHRDYAEAHRYLEQSIEPARRKVFVHYLRAAKDHEQQGDWAAAMWSYDEAKSMTIKPANMEKKRAKMEVNMRQLRFDKLLNQRRKEDAALLMGAGAYAAPRGIHANDGVYGRLRGHYQDQLGIRALHAYREAKRFLRKKLPEIAYVEIESYMRFQPGTAQGKKILAEIRRNMPNALSIPSLQWAGVKQVGATKRMAMPKLVTAEHVLVAMRSGDLIAAKQLVQALQRSDSKSAEKLLVQVQRKLRTKAATLFAQGSKAFAQEKLEQAIALWRDAVALRPEKPEYHEALRRAQQLKERLNLLRDQKPASPMFEEE